MTARAPAPDLGGSVQLAALAREGDRIVGIGLDRAGRLPDDLELTVGLQLADEGGLSPLALALRGEGNPSYARVDELARGIAGGLEPLRAQGIAPVVLVEADQAKVLGQAMAQRVEGPLLCLDSVGVDNGDYIDIGAPVAGGAVLPVVIKTLVFNKS